MFHGIVFLLFAAELVWVASGAPSLLWPLAYPALSFAIAGVAFIAGRPGGFGKRPDGHFAPWFRLVHAPFRFVASISALLRQMRTKDCYNEITDGLWLGARVKHLPQGIARIVDLTVEHDRIGPDDVEYHLIATLDGQAPDRNRMAEVIEVMRREPMPTYVHCFAGRGRSATFVASYLLATARFETVDEAEQFLQGRRPSVRLSSSQRAEAASFEPR